MSLESQTGSHFSPAPLDELRIPVVGGGHAILIKVFQQDLALLIREHHSSCLCIRFRRDVCVRGQGEVCVCRGTGGGV